MATRKTTSKTATSKNKPATPDAIALLKADHADVKTMYQAYKKLVEAEADGEDRQALAMQICQALTVHTMVEEDIFYPAARDALDDHKIMNHADIEHDSAKELIAQIEAMDPDDSHYDAKVCVLCEYVQHHVDEEESEMFPKVRKAKLDLTALGEQMALRKQELSAEDEDPVGAAEGGVARAA